MIARPALLALAAAAAATAPFRTEEPHVRDGIARLAAAAPAEALRLFDEAERAVGSHAEIDLARGHARLAEGDRRAAVDAWRRAAGRAPPALASRALQNVGTALATAGDRDGAARALADALSRDPSNEDARWNLEVLLRRRAAGEPRPRDPAEALPSDRGGAADARDREDEAGRRDARPAAPADARPDGEPATRADDARAREGAAPLSRQDAEALLDALRARERSVPFFEHGERGERRPDAAKDW
jgi:tetratricopeptide (TPR) repeat protein